MRIGPLRNPPCALLAAVLAAAPVRAQAPSCASQAILVIDRDSGVVVAICTNVSGGGAISRG
jgi:hypothetical protein